MGCAESKSLFTALLAKADEDYAAAEGTTEINPAVIKMVRIIHGQVDGLNAIAAYLESHGGKLPAAEAKDTVEAAMEAVGSQVVSSWNLEVQIAAVNEQLVEDFDQDLIDDQLALQIADHKKISGQLKTAVHLFGDVWKLALPAKPIEADDLAAFAQLPLADAPGKLTQIGVVGWLYLNDQTSVKASGSSLAPYEPHRDGMWRDIQISFTGGVTAIINHSDAAFSATVSSFAAARTVIAEPLNQGVLQDIDHYQKVYEEACSASTTAGEKQDVLVRLGAAVEEAKGTTPSEEHAAEVTVDAAAPPDPATLEYAMYKRRMAAPTALFLYLLASTLISSIPEAVGAVCVPGPIKGLIRMVAKVIDRYASFEPCRDVARCTVHFPTLNGMVAFLLALTRSGLVYILRVKNRYDQAYDSLPAGGYRDLQLLLLLPDGGGTVLDGIRDNKVFRYVELQLNLAAMVEIKDGKSNLQKAKLAEQAAGGVESALLGRAGHEIFNLARAVDAFSAWTLRYKGPPTTQICEAIKVGALLEVDFGGAGISLAKLVVFGSEQCRVRTLNLFDSNLGPDGGKVLAKALETNVALKELVLYRNELNTEGAKAITEMLKVNTTLQSINLHENWIDAESGKAIAEMLKVNTSLQSIDLGGNDSWAEAGKAIAEMLKVNTTLQSIRLKGNDLGAESGKAIAEMLKVNTSLQSIDLESNSLRAEAGKAIAVMLKVNTTLQSINLGSNNLGVEAGKAIAEMLKVNTSLQSIDLRSNDLGTVTASSARHLAVPPATSAAAATSSPVMLDPPRDLVFPLPAAIVNSANRSDCVAVFLEITNTTDGNAMYKVKTTAPKAYVVRPHMGELAAGQTAKIKIILQPFRGQFPTPAEVGKVKFLVQVAEERTSVLAAWAARTTDKSLWSSKGSTWQHKLSAIASVADQADTAAPEANPEPEMTMEFGEAIAEMLKVNTTLQSINLENNKLDSKTKAAIKTAWGGRDADKLEL